MLENKSVVYKYSVKLMWPAMCRNRSVEILKERPDLVDQMNKFRQKVENVLKLVSRKHFQVDATYLMSGIRLWFESGQDCYDFIIRQPEFEWQIQPELSVMNPITSQLQTFEIVYTPTGITVD
tara:strand:+ start:859 stop:1227 length:369 start_codon:yes stop_codon:yes gene_type:complete